MENLDASTRLTYIQVLYWSDRLAAFSDHGPAILRIDRAFILYGDSRR